MKKDDIYYGLARWEKLEEDPESAVERILGAACVKVGEEFDVLASRIEWPIKILVFKRYHIDEVQAESIATDVVEYILERLDEEYAAPDGDSTDATEGMNLAALAFGRAVVLDYVPWMCEPTGEVIEYTREQAERGETCVHNGKEE